MSRLLTIIAISLVSTVLLLSLTNSARVDAQTAVPAGAPGQQMVTGILGDPRTPISSLPFVIDQCGSYYVTDCLTGVSGQNGITINVSDVTIDLNGFTLTGVAGSLDGIVATAASTRIKVHNGSVVSWDGDGIDLSQTTHVQLRDVSVSGNGANGASSGDSSQLFGCSASGNAGDGLSIAQSSIARDCTADSNMGSGFEGSGDCSLIDCIATGNTLSGIHLGEGHVVRSCVASFNGEKGVFGSRAGLIAECVANGNGQNGFDLRSWTKIMNCAAHFNTLYGIWARTGDCSVEGNATFINSGGFDIFLDTTTTVAIRNHVSPSGINLTGGDIAPVQRPSIATNPFANFPQ